MRVRADLPEDNRGTFVLNDFSGGMRRDTEPFRLEDNQYTIMSNGRARFGSIIPLKLPLEMTGLLPAGKYQGLYGYDTVLIAIISGRVYGMDLSQATPAFQIIPDVLLDEFADTIYAELVPSSWQNLQRKLSDGTDVTAGIKLFSQVFGTPACLILQDGIGQPWLIFTTGSARRAHTFSDWSNTELEGQDTREYVPVGRQMMYSADGRLYIISADSKEIYRSVTGRPLDFVVAIDQNGDKLAPLTSGKEEASRLSYKVSFEPITCIAALPSAPRVQDEEAGFYLGSRKRSWIIYPHYRTPLFGEPAFTNQFLFSSGPINQFSITDVLGDVGIVTESGITTFNSILTASNEGQNLPFHSAVHKLFVRPDGSDIVQTLTASIASNDYSLFAMDTIHGSGILVYDTLRKAFVSFDIYPEVEGQIRQFAEIKVNGKRRLFFITTGNQLFEYEAGETAMCSVYTKEIQSDDAETEIIPRRIRLVFSDIQESGEVAVTEIVNNVLGDRKTATVSVDIPIQTIPLSIPFGDLVAENIKNKTFTIERPNKGQQVGLLIEFNFIASLQKVELVSEGDLKATTDDEAGVIFNNVKTL